MLWLIAGFICSALVSIVLKASGRLEYDRYGMLTVNYAACLVPFLISQAGKPLPAADRDFAFCIIFAAINGLLYLAGMIMNQMNVRRNGAILQSTFARLGVMVPACLSILLFGERPSVLQAGGMILVIAAFCIMQLPQKRDTAQERMKPAFGLLILGLLFSGMADSMLKVFEEYGNAALDDWFMGATFLFSALLCLCITLWKKERIGKREIMIGLVLGIPNYLSSLLLLRSLSSISAYIAYPTYSVGAILTVTAVSTLFFREKLSFWSRTGVAMIIPAVILLNI